VNYFLIADLLLICLPAGHAQAVQPEHPSQSPKDRPWQELFDGQSLTGWRGYRQPETPISGWSVINGVLFSDGSSRTDLITTRKYNDYELIVEWRTGTAGF